MVKVMNIKKNRCYKNKISTALCVGLFSLLTHLALADGTKTLGPPPPEFDIATGTGIVAAGAGLIFQPSSIELDVPGEVKQAIIYWECQMDPDDPADDTIMIDGNEIVGTLIGGPNNFFRTTFSSTFRADITALGLVDSGLNTLEVKGLDCSAQLGPTLEKANNGAGLLVIYNDNSQPEAQIQIRDGNDLAFEGFGGHLQVTEPQTFIYDESDEIRNATLVLFFSSISGTASGSLGFRPSSIEVTVGNNTMVFDDLLDSNEGDEWDTVILSFDIPANETMLTVQAFSVDNPPLSIPGYPASFAWNGATLSVPKPVSPPEPLDGRMNGGGKIINTAVTHGFELHCNLATPNRLQVNWDKGNKFHLTSLDSAICSDDPAIDPAPPVVDIDTFNGTGTGRFNNVDGATIEFQLVDAGEPGVNDTATFLIKDVNGNVVLDVMGTLTRKGGGNHQALVNNK